MNLPTQTVGKIGEYAVIGKLMSIGMKVFTPVVDVGGVDAIVQRDDGLYNEVQIKTRTKGHRNFQMPAFQEKENLFVILHYEGTDDFWILPSKVFKSNIVGKVGKEYKRLTLSMSREKRQKLERYRNAFDLLRR